MDLDIDHLRQWIGREDVVTDTLTAGQAAGLHGLLDRPGEPPRQGEPAGDAGHWCVCPDRTPQAGLGEDGHPERGGFLPPVPLPRRLWASGAVSIATPLLVGETVTRRSRIADVQLKEGSSGPLVIVEVDHSYIAAEQPRIGERQVLVYKDAGETARPARPAPAIAVESTTVTPDPVLLFRYSALTYNAHRIHYDRPWAVEREGQPGLLVHAPLLASLLLDRLRARIGGRAVKALAFRAHRPLHDGAPIGLHLGEIAEEGGRPLHAWATDPEGRVAFTLQAVPGPAR